MIILGIESSCDETAVAIVKDKKEVMLYTDYDKQKADSYLNQYNDWHIQNGLNSTIKDNKIVITF